MCAGIAECESVSSRTAESKSATAEYKSAESKSATAESKSAESKSAESKSATAEYKSAESKSVSSRIAESKSATIAESKSASSRIAESKSATIAESKSASSRIAESDSATIAECESTAVAPKTVLVRSKVASAVLAAGLTTVLTNPLDIVKIGVQVGSHGAVQTVKNVFSQRGVRGFYVGLLPALGVSVPSAAVYYVGYDLLREHVLDNAAFAGACARVLAVVASSPLEIIKTQRQSAHTLRHHSPWLGIVPTLLRDVVFSAAYWSMFDRTAAHPVFAGGCLAGLVAATLTHPLDSLKTAQQATSLPTLTAQSLHRTFTHLVSTRGYAALYAGLVPRLLKIVPACGIMMYTYEYGKTVL